MRTRRGIQISDQLNVALSENPFWKSLFEVFANVADATFNEQLEQLSALRSALHIRRGDWIALGDTRAQVVAVDFEFADNDAVSTNITVVDSAGTLQTVTRRAIHDRDILIANARQLGFDFFSDSFSDISYLQLIESLGEFWPSNGTHDFINYIGYIKQTRLEMNKLWSREDDPDDLYQTLEPRSSSMVPVTQGGPYYPTSHYEVIYDALSNFDVDVTDIVKLFYLFAPINFVLARVSGQIEIDQPYAIVAGGALQVTESVALPLQVQTSDQLRFVGFELGLVDTSVVDELSALNYTRLLNGASVPGWTTQHAGDDIRYQQWDTSVVLKCYVPHAVPRFRYNAVKLYAAINDGLPFAYSINVFSVVNPKLSSEQRNDGSSWFMWVQVQLPPPLTAYNIVWDPTHETRPAFRVVDNFNTLNAPARESHDQFAVMQHDNVVTYQPHMVFASETLYYGAPLLPLAAPTTLYRAREVYAIHPTEPVPQGLVPILDDQSNSLMDAAGRILYHRELR